jgi:hypothetical protein
MSILSKQKFSLKKISVQERNGVQLRDEKLGYQPILKVERRSLNESQV